MRVSSLWRRRFLGNARGDRVVVHKADPSGSAATCTRVACLVELVYVLELADLVVAAVEGGVVGETAAEFKVGEEVLVGGCEEAFIVVLFSEMGDVAPPSTVNELDVVEKGRVEVWVCLLGG